MISLDMWLARHTVEKTMPVLERALRTIKETYAEQARNGTYAVGYCFGGKYVLKLAATNEIKAGSLAHGTLKQVLEKTNSPILTETRHPSDLRGY